MAPPHAHISRIRVFIFPRMHLKFSRWRCLDSKLLASEQQFTNQWVTSRMLRPFIFFAHKLSKNHIINIIKTSSEMQHSPRHSNITAVKTTSTTKLEMCSDNVQNYEKLAREIRHLVRANRQHGCSFGES